MQIIKALTTKQPQCGFEPSKPKAQRGFTLAEPQGGPIDYTNKAQRAFTLAEVLITLAVIGVVAAISIPSLQANIVEQERKVAYKKAFADASIAYTNLLKDNVLETRTTKFSQGNWINFEYFKSQFSIQKECVDTEVGNCWGNMDESEHEFYGLPSTLNGYSAFIDAEGRSWINTATQPWILLDTNGLKQPNLFGKDRFVLIFSGTNTNCVEDEVNNNPAFLDIPIKLATFCDVPNIHTSRCKQGGCYYNSWLR